MSWTRYLMHDFFTARELNEMEGRMNTMRSQSRRRRSSERAVSKRVTELEDDLGRLSLLTCALLELGLENGAFTKEDLARRMQSLDASDGKADGKLDRGWLRGNSEEPEA